MVSQADTTPRRRRGARRWVRQLLLLAAATIAALVVSELAVRLTGGAPEIKPIDLSSTDSIYRRSTNPILGFELKASYRHDDPDNIQTYGYTNAHGQRDVERTVEKPAGVRRVILLGDSIVQGLGLSEIDQLMSRQMEMLDADGATEVLNFGVSGYCTRAEVELLERKGLQFSPDVVVLVFDSSSHSGHR